MKKVTNAIKKRKSPPLLLGGLERFLSWELEQPESKYKNQKSYDRVQKFLTVISTSNLLKLKPKFDFILLSYSKTLYITLHTRINTCLCT